MLSFTRTGVGPLTIGLFTRHTTTYLIADRITRRGCIDVKTNF